MERAFNDNQRLADAAENERQARLRAQEDIERLRDQVHSDIEYTKLKEDNLNLRNEVGRLAQALTEERDNNAQIGKQLEKVSLDKEAAYDRIQALQREVGREINSKNQMSNDIQRIDGMKESEI